MNRGRNRIELPCFQYFILYFLTVIIWTSNTKCATHWKFEHGEVNVVNGEEESMWNKDPFFRILVDPVPTKKTEKENVSFDFLPVDSTAVDIDNEDENNPSGGSALSTYPLTASQTFEKSSLTCGKPVNETSLDHLEGISERQTHPVYPEPEVAYLFRKNEFDSVQFEVIEVNLLDALKSGENKLILFNQIGNFLRIKGDTYHSIECFRSALVITHDCPDIYLNLARMMLNLNYVKDAVYLAERSLDLQSSDQSSWLQHFTLGECLSQAGEIDRAVTHFQMALEENPAFHPAQLNLRKLQNTSIPTSSNLHTFSIISILCSIFLLYIYHAIIKEPSDENNNAEKRVFFSRPKS